jgi:hypothetical protein
MARLSRNQNHGGGRVTADRQIYADLTAAIPFLRLWLAHPPTATIPFLRLWLAQPPTATIPFLRLGLAHPPTATIPFLRLGGAILSSC